ncbi:MAG: hypothetical protein AB7F35_01020 [Acetobacteraceae bacterium]
MDDKQHELTMHEFDSLREEISGYTTEIRKLEVYAVAATAVFYWSLMSLEKPGQKDMLPFYVPVWAWALPIFFPLLGLIRGRVFYKQVTVIADYIRQIEEQYGRTPTGWEHHIKSVRERRQTGLGQSSIHFALLLVLFSCIVFAWRLIAVYVK